METVREEVCEKENLSAMSFSFEKEREREKRNSLLFSFSLRGLNIYLSNLCYTNTLYADFFLYICAYDTPHAREYLSSLGSLTSVVKQSNGKLIWRVPV